MDRNSSLAITRLEDAFSLFCRTDACQGKKPPTGRGENRPSNSEKQTCNHRRTPISKHSSNIRLFIPAVSYLAWCKAAGDDNGLICQPCLVVCQHPCMEGHVLCGKSSSSFPDQLLVKIGENMSCTRWAACFVSLGTLSNRSIKARSKPDTAPPLGWPAPVGSNVAALVAALEMPSVKGPASPTATKHCS